MSSEISSDSQKNFQIYLKSKKNFKNSKKKNFFIQNQNEIIENKEYTYKKLFYSKKENPFFFKNFKNLEKKKIKNFKFLKNEEKIRDEVFLMEKLKKQYYTKKTSMKKQNIIKKIIFLKRGERNFKIPKKKKKNLSLTNFDSDILQSNHNFFNMEYSNSVINEKKKKFVMKKVLN